MSMNNEKTACPAGPRTSGEDLGNKENPVCEKTITIQEKSQDSGWHHDAVVIETPTPSRVEPVKSKKSNAQLQQVTELYNVARRAVKIAARVMNADGLCRYDTVDKCRKVWPPADATCEKCIEKWLLAKARKELKHD